MSLSIKLQFTTFLEALTIIPTRTNLFISFKYVDVIVNVCDDFYSFLAAILNPLIRKEGPIFDWPKYVFTNT